MRCSVWRGGLLVLAASWAVCGCARTKETTVSGAVMLKGAPVDDAQVQLVPSTNHDLPSLAGVTDANGHFIIRLQLPPHRPVEGSYVVLVSKVKSGATMDDPVEYVVPVRYSDRSRTPLHVDLKEGENHLPPFELK